MKKEKIIFLAGWLMMAIALILGMALATSAQATVDEAKLEKLVMLTLLKGELDAVSGIAYLKKTEKIGEAERRLYFTVMLAVTPTSQVSITGVFCNEELWEKKIVDGKALTLVTQKMSRDREGFIDAFFLKDEGGSVIKNGSKAADPEKGKVWLDGFLTEMIKEFDQPATAPSSPRVVPKPNDLTI